MNKIIVDARGKRVLFRSLRQQGKRAKTYDYIVKRCWEICLTAKDYVNLSNNTFHFLSSLSIPQEEYFLANLLIVVAEESLTSPSNTSDISLAYLSRMYPVRSAATQI